MLLVIDSATPACSVALIDGKRIVAEHHEVVGRGHAERLLPMIETMLADRRPTAIAVDCGPGSFTGVRVGLAAAHGLAIGWRTPLFGYSSLALLAVSSMFAGEGANDEIAVALQAGHGQFFVQSYAHEPFSPRDPLRSLPPAEAVEAISAHVVVGNAAEALVAERGFGVAIDALPRAADVRLLPAHLRQLPPRPIYGREPDARSMT